MGWESYHFKGLYSRDLEDDIVNDFLVPALSEAVTYDRITGDFSSGFLAAAASGFGPFFLTNGKMRLITNGRFTENDITAINNGLSPDIIIERMIEEELFSDKKIVDTFEKKHIEALVWLLKNNRLEIKISLVKDNHGNPVPANNNQGIQHQKVGILSNLNNNKIAFIGSMNESLKALTKNGEGISVSYSWIDGVNKVQEYEKLFELLWNNNSKFSSVFNFPEASKRRLISTFDVDKMPDLSKPTEIVNKWAHQDEAIEKFLKIKNGILEMATGTGKTITALKIINELYDRNEITGIIIATKGNDLLDQWYKGCIKFQFRRDTIFYRNYGDFKEINKFLENIRKTRSSGLILSYMSLPELISRDTDNLLDNCFLICDELHNIGSSQNVTNLSGKISNFKWRLGLSATPEREYDEVGNDFIEKEFGNSFYQFGLKEAIEKGILCEFNYVPLYYDFNDEDRQGIKDAYSLYNYKKKSGEKVSIYDLYMWLANVRKISESKLPVFEEYIKNNKQMLERCVIFCETREYAIKIQKILIRYTSNYHTYYGDDDKTNLSHFSTKKIDCLITCKRISEGIDIQSINNIILFSSARAKIETIQRIGRCLRVDPLQPEKRANVIDFLNNDDFKKIDGVYEPVDKYRYNWLIELSKIRRE